MSDENKIELAKMLGRLREDLLKVQEQGKNSSLKFRIDEIELDLQVATTESAGAGGGVQFWVYKADAKVNVSEVLTQKLKLKLKPVDPKDNAPIELSGTSGLPGR